MIGGHRAMYPPVKGSSAQNLSEYIGEQYEYLLYKYKVGIAIWAHHHCYSRTCNIYQNKCFPKGNNNGTTHLIIGMSGATLNKDSLFPNPPFKYNMFVTNKIHGFMKFNFLNVTHMYGEFISSSHGKQGKVIDSFYVQNPLFQT